MVKKSLASQRWDDYGFEWWSWLSEQGYIDVIYHLAILYLNLYFIINKLKLRSFKICCFYPATYWSWASLEAQTVKNPPAIWETGFNPWVGKIPWRRAWQPTPVFLPGESPWTEESGGLQSMGSQRVRYDWVTKHTYWSYITLLTRIFWIQWPRLCSPWTVLGWALPTLALITSFF